jgi:signal transduction histidine kinase
MSRQPAAPVSDAPENIRPEGNAARGNAIRIPVELAAAIAHELNQPLAAILGNAQAARRFIVADGINRDELLAIVDDIIRDTKRAGGMVHDLRAKSVDTRHDGP